VPTEALACPECGADDATGWNERASVYDGTDLPDEDFDYAEFIQGEFGHPSPHASRKTVLRLGIAALVAGSIAFLLAWFL